MKTWLRVVAAGLMGVALACSRGSDDGPTEPTPPGALTAPTAESPRNDEQLGTLRPALTVRNGTSTGTGARVYEFQVSDRNDFTSTLLSQGGVAEGTTTTSFTPGSDLQPSTRLYWRARFTQGSSTSPWSAVAQFRTKLVGFNRPGELYDPLIHEETIGQRVGSTAFLGSRGLRVDNVNSWVRYQLASTITSGEISVEVEGLQPNGPAEKGRIFSMMDGGNSLFHSPFLFNVQYRGASGNPDNAISYKLLMGHSSLQYEPDFAHRAAGVRSFNPGTTYLWTATWGSTFRLTVREGGATGPIVYEQSESTPGLYNPVPHVVYLGANDAAFESGSRPGVIFRHLWVGDRPRPSSLGSALR